MTTSPSRTHIFFFLEPGIRPIRTTPSMHCSVTLFEPSKLATVARTSFLSLRGVRTLVISWGPSPEPDGFIGSCLSFSNSASVISQINSSYADLDLNNFNVELFLISILNSGCFFLFLWVPSKTFASFQTVLIKLVCFDYPQK